MQNITILDWITAISSVLTPILIIVLSAIFANSSKKQEKILELQAKLQDDRIKIYNSIIEPYIISASPEVILHQEKKYRGLTPGEAAGKIILTPEYKEAEFKLLLIGSDEVVRAYNEIKKYFYSGKVDGTNEATAQLLRLLGNLIVEIRKSVGNEGTKLSYRETVWLFVKDPETMFEEIRK